MNHPNNFPVFLVITSKNGNPALEIRKLTSDPIAIKTIIDCAIIGKPIIVFPTFRDKIRAISTLMERNIIKYNPKSKCYDFLI